MGSSDYNVSILTFRHTFKSGQDQSVKEVTYYQPWKMIPACCTVGQADPENKTEQQNCLEATEFST